MDMSRHNRWGSYRNISEPEYDVVDDQEELRNVCILPARPIHDETEYADRVPLRSSDSSHSTDKVIVPPRRTTFTPGPAINRDLKPGRRKTNFEKRSAPVPPGDQRPHRHAPSPPPSRLELISHLPGLTMHEARKRDGRRISKTGEFGPCTKGLQHAEDVSAPYASQRYSMDLETSDLDKRSRQSLERMLSKHLHHEWPQSKEDQHDFALPNRPQQTYYEEDWYIGACSRADAEHALHLVNRDGAFLIRDCSTVTSSEPLVLTVYHDKKVYNVKIRFIERTSKYALGTRQQSDDMFDSVADMIKFHSIFPIILMRGRSMPGSRYPDNCVLTCPVTKRDVEQLLQ